MTEITILFDRDSVCMGDDANDHRREITVNGSTLLSDFLKMLIKYVPSMADIVWSVKSNLGVIGYIIGDSQRQATIEICGDDKPIDNLSIDKVFCTHFYESNFTWIDGKTKEKVTKFQDCKTLLEKVKRLQSDKK